jgi:hypothetical protein
MCSPSGSNRGRLDPLLGGAPKDTSQAKDHARSPSLPKPAPPRSSQNNVPTAGTDKPALADLHGNRKRATEKKNCH